MPSQKIMATLRHSAVRWTRQICRGPPGTTSTSRNFSITGASKIRTTDMKEDDFRAIKVDRSRLMDTLHHTCSFGTGKRWGRQDQLHFSTSPLQHCSIRILFIREGRLYNHLVRNIH